MIKLTKSGMDLLLRTIAGEASIKFSAIQFGNGSDAGNSATELSNPLLTEKISAYEIQDIFVNLSFIFSNSEVPAGFRATELGVFVDDPDNKDVTMLYAYGYTPEAEADYIPSGADKLLETQMDILVYIGEAENVTASISQSLVYAGKEELEAHVQDRSNPHGVDKAAVGLGNVPNVATNDQTPTFTEAVAPAVLKSGEKLSVAFGKLAAAVSALIVHLAAKGKNVHKETAESIGAAKTSHRHSAADITSGVLGTARGGLGNTSGKAASAVKLETARTVQVDLASGEAKSFNGTANIAPGVKGILPPEHGGTGVESLAALGELLLRGKTLAVRRGSYVGTGTYGEEHPVRLEFEFEPALVVITGTFGSPDVIENATVCFVNPGTDQLMTARYYLGGSVGGAHYYKFDGNALLMYDNNSYGKDYLNWQGAQQANMAGETYYYIALGFEQA